jgi:hypothetical protein
VSVADRRDWTYTRHADGSEWTTMPREDFKELHRYVEASSAFEDAYNAMQDYAQAAVWCMCEARWWAEYAYNDAGVAVLWFPWETP